MVAMVGLASLLGLWGVGATVLAAVRLKLPQPWSSVTASLLGILTVSLAVQVVAMAGVASLLVLRLIWAIMAAAGLIVLALHVRAVWPQSPSRPQRAALGLLAIVGAALLVNFLIAIAPSTKIDEIYYHMLTPARIVADGALRFYRQPWEGAITPQMVFQIAATPLHAVGYPDAPNVVSWGLGALLVWFAVRLIRAEGASYRMAALWAAALCVGLYPAVWQVTGGSHAMGDLALASAVVALADGRRLLDRLSPAAYLAMVSILLVAAAASKVSLLPVSLLILALAAWRATGPAKPWPLARLALIAAAPWLIFYAPLVVWTWVHSGSPFGPILAGRFGPSAYDLAAIRTPLDRTQAAGRGTLAQFAFHTLLDYSPLIWIGGFGALIGTALDRSTRIMLAAALALQVLLIVGVLPYEARFLSGLPFGLMIAFAAWPSESVKLRLTARWMAPVAGALFVLPWFGLQLYYAKAFVPVALGLEKEAFYRRNVPLYDDDLKLDRILPPNVVLFTPLHRVTNVYSPRPVVYERLDLPPGKPVVVLAPTRVWRTRRNPAMGQILYSNPNAVLRTGRTPGSEPMTGPIEVRTANPR